MNQGGFFEVKRVREIAQSFFETQPVHRRWTRLLQMLREFRADIEVPYEAEVATLRAGLARACGAGR